MPMQPTPPRGRWAARLLGVAMLTTAQNIIYYPAARTPRHGGVLVESGRARVAVAPPRDRPQTQKAKTDPVSLKAACKASIKGDWRPERQAIGYTYHKNSCMREGKAAKRRTWHPPKCPHVTPTTAKRCLAKKNISRIVLIGDSITYQLWGSLLCTEATTSGFGAAAEASIQNHDVDYEPGSRHGFSVADAFIGGGLKWTFLKVRGQQRAGALVKALEQALDRGLLAERALYVVNAGLWHLLCTTQHAQCLQEAYARAHGVECDCLDPMYGEHLARLFTVLQRANGPVVWRYTTAVHPQLFPERMGPVDRRKFRGFTDLNVRRLNKIADTLIKEDFPTQVTARRDAYNFTLQRGAGGHIKGDARHLASGALGSLVGLLFLEDACDYGRLARGLVGRWWQDW